MFSQPLIQKADSYTTGHVFVTYQSRYDQILVHHNNVQELNSKTSASPSWTESVQQTSCRHLWAIQLPNKTLESLFTVREHPDCLKPTFWRAQDHQVFDDFHWWIGALKSELMILIIMPLLPGQPPDSWSFIRIGPRIKLGVSGLHHKAG